MSEFKKLQDGSYVCNCYLERREGDISGYLFHQDGLETVKPFLNGYAIIPIEVYARLSGEDLDDMIAAIADADIQLSK